jgi:zinc dependent phospholipase C
VPRHAQAAAKGLVQCVIVGTMVFAGLCAPKPAEGYSVLAHEANIDALWDSTIEPLLQARFPEATPEQVVEARAYAYGGCVIQDLGYYPFGSHFFSNLLHYVRSGDFVDALIRDAQDIDEYAFALGALGHYAADNSGHPLAVNRAVPLMYPKLKAEFGNTVTYAQSPKSHVLVEFSFDVVQVAAGAYAPEAYHGYIGFKVAKPALERAFLDTYGIEMKDLFLNEDLAIATYRHAVGTTIPEMTKVAWGKKRDEIVKVTPGMQREKFVFNLPRKQYDKEFGSDYAKPHGFARFLAVVYHLVPKIGLFRSLSFSVPTPEAERLFLESFIRTSERFRHSLDALRAGRLRLPNTNFDTGQPTARGEYSLADITYDELLDKLADRRFAGVPAALGANIVAYYGAADPLPGAIPDQQKRSIRIRSHVASLKATCSCP